MPAYVYTALIIFTAVQFMLFYYNYHFVSQAREFIVAGFILFLLLNPHLF